MHNGTNSHKLTIIIEALEEVYPTPSQDDLECQVMKLQWTSHKAYNPDDYCADLESSHVVHSKHFSR